MKLVIRVLVPGPRPEKWRARDAQRDVRQNQVEVEPEEDLHQDRGSPKEPDVEPAHPRHHGVGGYSHHCEDDPERDADDHG